MVTVKETLCAMADASDMGVPKVAIFQPAITKATRRRNGDTVITFTVVTNEFTVDDLLRGLVAWLALGDIERVRVLQQDLTRNR